MAGVAMAIAAVAAMAQGAPGAEERRALGFVAAVSAGDADALVAFLEENLTEAMYSKRDPDGWHRMAEMLKRHEGLEASGIEIERPHEVRVIADSPVGMRLELIFDFEPTEPYRIAGFTLRPYGDGHGGDDGLPDFELAEGAGAEGAAAALGAWFAEVGKLGAFSGTALVALDGEPIFEVSQGLASREWGAPNRPSTRFDLGSINKTFTKVAIAQLLEAGKLALDDTISKHLPDYPNPQVAAAVTIQHLLDHSSGIGDIFTEEFRRSSKALYREPEDFFPLFADRPLLFEPGEGSSYSNGGFMVLGAIVARVTGRPYADYVEEKVFGPAGMEASGFFHRDEPHPDVAVGYTAGHGMAPGDGHDGGEATSRTNIFVLPARGNSAGSSYATAADLLRFDEALRNHRLTSPASTRWVLGGPPPQEGNEVSEARNATGIGIAGGAPGVSAVLESGGRVTIVVLANQDEPGAEAISRRLRRPLTRALGD